MDYSTRAELIMLGTGNAAVTRSYNTCFILKEGEHLLLVDGGGGNGILLQLEKAGIALSDIHDIFVTHAHTDHILGVIWVLRMIAQQMNKGSYEGELHIYGHDKVIQVIDWICRMTLPSKIVARIGKGICLQEVRNNDRLTLAEVFDMQFFDILSTKEKQFGFHLWLPDGQRLVCLGDEPFNEQNRHYVEKADWLLCEAFCLYTDRERFKPYEKHHSTALDAGKLAAKLNVGRLLLYHTEDKTLPLRKQTYTAEAASAFSRPVFVPDDLETIPLFR